ncbi:lipase family protein [Algicola sagamiensis]|uniref:lipase family protein n=1 Tax=Algicola sagamiensis TaxID=163869 RepID=UPI000361BD24|nr:lipase family protein [Algicola sagamiensis]
MSTLTPLQAAEFADLVYEAKDVSTLDEIAFPTSLMTQYIFSNKAVEPIKGRSGSPLLKSKGFVLPAFGIGLTNKDDLVLSFRGTAGKRDVVTDLNCGFSGADCGSVVHSGFNNTFNSFKDELIPLVKSIKPGNTIHCVGHSLGGALASLAADWIRRHYHRDVKLYTFGSPRVGTEGFSRSTTNLLTHNNIYRCVNGGDPITMIPVWPFLHAPHEGIAYFCSSEMTIINPLQHKMVRYIDNVKTHDWNKLEVGLGDDYLKKVYLKQENASWVRRTLNWAKRISQALVTLLYDAGPKGAGLMAMASVGNTLNLFDRISMILHDEYVIQKPHSQQHLQGLLAHMMTFCGYSVGRAVEMSVKNIRWIFGKMMDKLQRMAKEALDIVSL